MSDHLSPLIAPSRAPVASARTEGQLEAHPLRLMVLSRGPPTGGTPGVGGAPGTGPKANGRTTSKSFFGAADIQAAAAKTRLIELADEIIVLLAKDPTAEVELTVEMRAEFPEGAPEDVHRAVSENAKALKLKTAEWE